MSLDVDGVLYTADAICSRAVELCVETMAMKREVFKILNLERIVFRSEILNRNFMDALGPRILIFLFL